MIQSLFRAFPAALTPFVFLAAFLEITAGTIGIWIQPLKVLRICRVEQGAGQLIRHAKIVLFTHGAAKIAIVFYLEEFLINIKCVCLG
ncbi:hypothetical protein [Parapedobacter tibetensis]|uniref:hypothetical protein n=1 Tax=Parapedobacter tibetensis TaxID=2972951 RepID=UPI00214D3F94|nr:hypothetical protein [Parapedobacter tibetensis]